MTDTEKRLRTLLYNAICLLIAENFKQYHDSEEWFRMILNELGCSAEELEKYGIKATVDGRLYSLKE